MKTVLKEKIKQISTNYKLGDFFRNFIAVVLGIIITFAGNDWIQERSDQQEVKESIELIKQELQMNRDEIANMKERIELEQKGSSYLLKYKGRMKEANPDSLDIYRYLPFQWRSFNAMYDALEMLKTSGIIQKIKSKELSVQILTAYAGIRSSHAAYEVFCKIKQDLQNELNTTPGIKKILVSNNYANWDILFKYPEGLSLVKQILEIQSTKIYQNHIELIDKTIVAINKEYN